MFTDDIAAISTPPGEGGIAIVRVSGSTVIEKVNKIFRPHREGVDIREKAGYTLTLGYIVDEKDEKLDQVLLLLMRAPRSYTGEDTIEIHCHGGILPARLCLQAVLRQGIRMAEPGEFTRRAFLNGRLDASQAEAVIEVIRAKSEKSMKLALKQLEGHNSEYINKIRDYLVELNSMVEASLDFPDEVGELEYDRAKDLIIKAQKVIDRLIRAGKRADIYRHGIKVAIVGKPNVGKSSLLNALLRKERAIVTDIPGTTRDIIEEQIYIKGIPIRLIDTAGIRVTNDIVEIIGVEKSQEVIKEADLIIFLLDQGTGITEEDWTIYEEIKQQKMIIIVNKEDLLTKKIPEQELKQRFPTNTIIRASIKADMGLEEIEDQVEKIVLGGELGSDDLEMIVNVRHREALIKARNYLQDAFAEIEDVPLDCLGVDIWGALESIQEITGGNLKEEVIDRMFRDFCIGK